MGDKALIKLNFPIEDRLKKAAEVSASNNENCIFLCALEKIQHLEQRLAEVEADFDALKSIEGKLMDMEREWRDKDVGDNPMTIARAQGVADGLYQAAKLFKTNEV